MNDKVPVLTRFGRWARDIVRGDLGRTIDNQPVNDEIGRRMWVSLRLVLIGAHRRHLAWRCGWRVRRGEAVPALGPTASRSSRSSSCRSRLWSLACCSRTPGSGSTGLLGFTEGTRLLYTTGEITPGLDPWSWTGIVNRLAHLALPSLVLIVIAIAFYGRYQRNAMLDVLGSDFLRTARAKGSEPPTRPHQARPAHGAHSDGHVLRLRVRAAVRRCHFHREAVRLARHGRVFRRLGDEERRELGGWRHAVRGRSWCSSPGSCPTWPTRPSIRGCGSDLAT